MWPFVLAGLAAASCSDDPRRPPPPPPTDAGPSFDASAWDAASEPDASADLDSGPGAGTETVLRDYGTDFETCPPSQYPVWGDLSWVATIPDGATIRFSAQAAPVGENVAGGARASLGTTPPATPPIYVSDLLPEAHRNDPQLRVTAELRWPSADARPTLDSLTLDWECLDRQ